VGTPELKAGQPLTATIGVNGNIIKINHIAEVRAACGAFRHITPNRRRPGPNKIRNHPSRTLPASAALYRHHT